MLAYKVGGWGAAGEPDVHRTILVASRTSRRIAALPADDPMLDGQVCAFDQELVSHMPLLPTGAGRDRDATDVQRVRLWSRCSAYPPRPRPKPGHFRGAGAHESSGPGHDLDARDAPP